MERVLFPPLSRMAVCGGTHGNEMSGVYMLRELKQQSVGQVGSASLITVLSNPRAVESCRRYIDKDLNRCFTSHLLRQVKKIDENISKRKRPLSPLDENVPNPLLSSAPVTDDTPYEQKRAQELNAQLGPKGSQEAVDLLCDLHNTTSNMGLCLIFYSSDWIPLHILKYMQVIFGPGLHWGNGVCWVKKSRKSCFVCCAHLGWSDPHPWITPPALNVTISADFLQLLSPVHCQRACAFARWQKSTSARIKWCSHWSLHVAVELWHSSRSWNKQLSQYGFICCQSKMTSTPVRAIFVDVPASEAYSLESVGKHGFSKRLISQLQRFREASF